MIVAFAPPPLIVSLTDLAVFSVRLALLVNFTRIFTVPSAFTVPLPDATCVLPFFATNLTEPFFNPLPLTSNPLLSAVASDALVIVELRLHDRRERDDGPGGPPGLHVSGLVHRRVADALADGERRLARRVVHGARGRRRRRARVLGEVGPGDAGPTGVRGGEGHLQRHLLAGGGHAVLRHGRNGVGGVAHQPVVVGVSDQEHAAGEGHAGGRAELAGGVALDAGLAGAGAGVDAGSSDLVADGPDEARSRR